MQAESRSQRHAQRRAPRDWRATVRTGVLALAAVLLAACPSTHDPRVTNTPNGTYALSLPAYTAPAELAAEGTAGGRTRIPVSKLTIAAPAAGARIVTLGIVVISNYRDDTPIRWDYLLEESLTPRLRSALDALFVVDPASPVTADILFRFDNTADLKENGWCQYWEITMIAKLQIRLAGGGDPQIFEATGEDLDTNCNVITGFPLGSVVGASAGRAFDAMMIKAGTLDLNAATAQTAALPAPEPGR
jgi:hypothetical protein